MSVASREHNNALEVYHKLLTCQHFEEVATGVLHPLAEHLSAQTASFRQFHFNGDHLSIGRNCCHRVADRSHSQYTDYFHQMDPVLQYGMQPGGRLGSISRFGFDLFRLADICDYRSLTRTEYYQDFFRPNHIHHVLVLAFRLFGNRDQVALLGFHRPSGEPGFTKRDIVRARQAAPAVLSALNGMTLESALQRNRTIIDSLELASRDMGVALLDEDYSVLYANQRGRLALDLVQDEDKGQIVGGESGVLGEMERICESSDWTSSQVLREGRRVAITNPRHGGDGSATVRIRPLVREKGGAAFLVTTEGDAKNDGLLEQRMASFGLTSREKDLAKLLARGYSNQRISDTLCISIRTTENHLRSIYSKVEVKTRSQLICRLYAESHEAD